MVHISERIRCHFVQYVLLFKPGHSHSFEFRRTDLHIMRGIVRYIWCVMDHQEKYLSGSCINILYITTRIKIFMNYEELINVMKENLTDNDLPDEIQTMMAVFQLQLKSAIRTMPIKETYDRVIS